MLSTFFFAFSFHSSIAASTCRTVVPVTSLCGPAQHAVGRVDLELSPKARPCLLLQLLLQLFHLHGQVPQFKRPLRDLTVEVTEVVEEKGEAGVSK